MRKTILLPASYLPVIEKIEEIVNAGLYISRQDFMRTSLRNELEERIKEPNGKDLQELQDVTPTNP